MLSFTRKGSSGLDKNIFSRHLLEDFAKLDFELRY
ncbi:hypothetical protein ACVIJU_001638 [Aeribacillus sp. SP014]